jgi:hypothetical protein
MKRLTLHSHPTKGWVTVTLVAFDRKHSALGLAAGTEEPASDRVPSTRRSGRVPAAEQARLIAVFNGGFKAEHGGFGMMVDGDEYLPPKDDACAVGIEQGGAIRIGSWETLAGGREALRAYRQTPPCLVENGVVNPRLEGEHGTRLWGAAKGGDRSIRRSALGFDKGGRALIYAFADWTSARELAVTLAAAGLHVAAELDINWSYTRFFLFEHGSEGPRIRETLVPKLEYSPDRYTVSPSSRDFFYVTRLAVE